MEFTKAISGLKETYYRDNRFYFVLNLILLYGLWKVISFLITEVPYFINHWISFNEFVVQTLISGTLLFLNVFGYSVFESGKIIGIENSAGVLVAYGCTGIQLTILMAGLILASPGKWYYKIIFILIGIITIYLINITRIGLLSMYVYYFPERDFFEHKTYFNLAVFGMMFIMWMFWIKYIAVKSKTIESK